MNRSSLTDTMAARLLARDGIAAIWQLHVRAAASHRRGNWISALALTGVAEAAERLWFQGRGR